LARRKKQETETEAVEEVVNEVAEQQAEVPEEQAAQQQQEVNPREVLLQVFEQGARASDDWDKSQLRIQCILALQQVQNLADIPKELKQEIRFVMDQLLKAGTLHFGLQQILYPMVKELE